ncbi:hypothetical protein DRN58_04830 [Thermococci archaeon]|nr:MAG: hypothetical protein DRN58_04830 [Thermococci archaeon]
MREVIINGKKIYYHTFYFKKKQKEKIDEIKRENGFRTYSEAIRFCVNFYYKERMVSCAFCERKIKRKEAFRKNRKYFCDSWCHEYWKERRSQ